MLQIGMIVKILPDAEYSGKFTGYIGKVKNYFSQNKKVGVELFQQTNDASSKGLFWFSESKVVAAGTLPDAMMEYTAVIPDVTLEPVEPPLVEEPAEPEPVLLGSFRITAYCSCEKCCGEWAKNWPNGIVYGAAGVELKAGVSCASPLPLGTVVEVEGLGEYIVQDRPAQWVIDKYGENQIDIYFDNHEAASAFGLKQLNVYLKGEPEK